MRYYLKALARATVTAFNTDKWEAVEAIEEHNNGILKAVYIDLITGRIEYATQTTKGHLYTLTRSTRTGEVVRTAFWKTGDELTPVYHTEYKSVSDFLKAADYIAGFLTVH